jgi:hypothetical protein
MGTKLRDSILTLLFFGYIFNFGALLAPFAEVKNGDSTAWYQLVSSEFGIVVVAVGFLTGVVAASGLLRLTILFSLVELLFCGYLALFAKKFAIGRLAFVSVNLVGPAIVILANGLFVWAAVLKWKFETAPAPDDF